MAVFSLSPIADTDQLQISRSSDYHYWKTRKTLGISTEADPDIWFYTVHMGWWDDVEDPFTGQWEQLNRCLLEKGRLERGKMSGFWEILTARLRCPVRDMTASERPDGWTAIYWQKRRMTARPWIM